MGWAEDSLRWRDQTGRVWALSAMTTSHIQNSMKYLLRRAQELHDEKTVTAFQTVIDNPQIDLDVEEGRAHVEHLFYHLQMKPTEWVRRLPIMYGFHHELQDRRQYLSMTKDEGRANFEFPPL